MPNVRCLEPPANVTLTWGDESETYSFTVDTDTLDVTDRASRKLLLLDDFEAA